MKIKSGIIVLSLSISYHAMAGRYIEEWKEKAPWPDNAQVIATLIRI